MKLLKNWQWREDAVIYTRAWDVVHQPYPFYYYLVDGLKIELRKQINKYCAVVQDHNEFIKPEPIGIIDNVVDSIVTPVEEMYIDRRSWMTLGEVPFDPIDQISTFVWGTRKVQLSFTPDGQLYERKEWSYDQITFKSLFEYSKKKDRYFARHYSNSDGVDCYKHDGGWQWNTGKPLIEKKYGKRK
jgi:hypothetical protein